MSGTEFFRVPTRRRPGTPIECQEGPSPRPKKAVGDTDVDITVGVASMQIGLGDMDMSKLAMSSILGNELLSSNVGDDEYGPKALSRKPKSVENCVLSALAQASARAGFSKPVIQILESLIWPFVCRRSFRKEVFTNKEFGRFIRSIRYTGSVLQEMRDMEIDREQSYAKYWLDNYLSKVFKDENPDYIDVLDENGLTKTRIQLRSVRDPWNTRPLFEGWCRTAVLRAIARRDVSFIYSLQKGSKQAWPKLGEVKEQSALDKHKLRVAGSRGELPEDLVRSIRETSSAVLGSVSFDAPQKFIPSGSACLQASVSHGGALSLVERFQLPFESKLAERIGKLPVLAATINEWRQKEYSNLELNSISRCLEWDEKFHCPAAFVVRVMAIPEPGKFRIITLGDGYLYTILQPLQGLLLSAWKRSRFATMRNADLTDRVREMDVELADVPLWCSVDYEAATDLLKRACTLAALEGLPSSAPLVSLAKFCMMSTGTAVYPDGNTVDASEGQFMGHPLSFPLLCCINLAVYHLALKRWVSDDALRRQVLPKLRKNVIVNGDDMLFKCFPSFYPYFIRTAADAGFKISAGKNYLSPDCCMINSQVFRRVGTRMERNGYLNMRLVKGTSLKTGESHATPPMLGKELTRMVNYCPWSAGALVSALSRFKKDWFGWYKPNWYVPVHLGGYGLPVKIAKEFRVTRDQRLLAAMFISRPDLSLYRSTGKTQLPLASLKGALANYLMTPTGFISGHGELEESEFEDSDDPGDPWLERLALASRYAFGSSGGESDKAFAIRFRREFRLKPVSLETLANYWTVKYSTVGVPNCPPLAPIRVRNLPWWELTERIFAGEDLSSSAKNVADGIFIEEKKEGSRWPLVELKSFNPPSRVEDDGEMPSLQTRPSPRFLVRFKDELLFEETGVEHSLGLPVFRKDYQETNWNV